MKTGEVKYLLNLLSKSYLAKKIVLKIQKLAGKARLILNLHFKKSLSRVILADNSNSQSDNRTQNYSIEYSYDSERIIIVFKPLFTKMNR